MHLLIVLILGVLCCLESAWSVHLGLGASTWISVRGGSKKEAQTFAPARHLKGDGDDDGEKKSKNNNQNKCLLRFFSFRLSFNFKFTL